MITRKSNVPATHSIAQLLTFLQVEGHLQNVTLPDWAQGTSVEELLDTVRLIGDGEWLIETEEYSDHSPQDAADSWLQDFIEGFPVCHPDDI